MVFLTDFADEAVILPLAAVVAIMLAVLGWWRGAFAWTAAVGGVLAVMAGLKIVFAACAGPLNSSGIQSPSGHTAAASVTYGGIFLLLARDRLPVPVLAVIPLGIAILIGVSRVALHAHVPVEVWLGGGVGLAGAAILLPLAGPQPPLRRWPVVLACFAVMAAFHGFRLPGEQMIHSIVLLSWLPWDAMCRG